MSVTTEQTNLMKLAASTIRDLQLKYEKLEDDYLKISGAIDIAFSLLKQGKLAADDMETYVKEASTKKVTELALIKEAAVFGNSNLNTFSVSNQNEFSDEEPDLIGFLLNS